MKGYVSKEGMAIRKDACKMKRNEEQGGALPGCMCTRLMVPCDQHLSNMVLQVVFSNYDLGIFELFLPIFSDQAS